MTENSIAHKKGGIGWIRIIQIALIILIVGILVLTNKGLNKPKTSQEQHCTDNPTDNETCHCVKTMVPHTRFWTEFNDTTPNIIRTMNETGKNPYSETMTVEVYGGNQTGFIMMKNLTKDYFLIYDYEAIEGKCVEAKPRAGGSA